MIIHKFKKNGVDEYTLIGYISWETGKIIPNTEILLVNQHEEKEVLLHLLRN